MTAALLAGLRLPAQALASPGPYAHGAGIKSQGTGRVGYALGEESIAISTNPAIAAALDRRNDLGVSIFLPKPYGEWQGNLLGPNEGYDADGPTIYPISRGGLIRHLSDSWSVGVSLLLAGLGPNCPNSPSPASAAGDGRA